MLFEYLKIFYLLELSPVLSPRQWRNKSISLWCLPHSRIHSVCRTRFLKSALDDIEWKRIRTSRAQIEDGGRFPASRGGFSASRQLPPPFIPSFFSCTRYKLTPCFIPKPRPHSSVVREIPCATCVVTSTHAAHYLWPAPRELISDINTRIRILSSTNENRTRRPASRSLKLDN